MSRKLIERRSLLASVGAIAVPGPLRAQAPARLRVGTANVQPRSAPQWVAFIKRMAEFGYVEGRNFTYDHVLVPNDRDWEASYRQVMAGRPNIVIAAGPEASLRAALAVSGTTPVVMVAIDFDPVARGFITSLAKPSSRVTGLYSQLADLAGKHLQLVRETMPDRRSATVLLDAATNDYWAALQAASAQAGIRLAGIDLGKAPYDYEKAIAEAGAKDRNVLITMASPFFYRDRVRIAELALKYRLPTMTQARASTTAGYLMSYGPDLDAIFARAATYIDRIAKGASPGDLPVEQPTRFELVVNLGTAKALDVAIPPAILARADEVIE